ncbi:MAG: UDP-N-acetylmuramate dehydrogenase [Gammaproteobacteria bacterium]|jgi:UDP-N-acetylmuramate dehydrogenase|nr:UDP-N-acetylmuramate dehydrogenase [Gammaproteobacteria bacterium]
MAAQRDTGHDRYGNRLRRNEPMSKHTSWRVGGPADIWFRPQDRAELIDFLRDCDPQLPLHCVGLGSNLLVRDGGVRGAVVSLQDAAAELEFLGGGKLRAGAGVPCAIVARRCVSAGAGPAEFFAGIPGTVGGALRMNAGAFGGETWTHVESVEVIDRRGVVQVRSPAEYTIGYREVTGPADEWFLGAVFRFPEHARTSAAAVRDLLAERRLKQPLGLPSCGSVFRNPDGDHAARLIETAGLKGFAIGGAEVSAKHANFIINTGAATAADIEALISHVQETVRTRHGVTLQPEVQIIGEAQASC